MLGLCMQRATGICYLDAHKISRCVRQDSMASIGHERANKLAFGRRSSSMALNRPLTSNAAVRIVITLIQRPNY